MRPFEFLDRTVKTPEDVERDIRLPFLGAVPAFEKSWKEATGGMLVQRHDNARPSANGLRYADCERRHLLGKLSRAQDFAAVFFCRRAAAQHSRDVRHAWGRKEHDGRQSGDRPGADGGSDAHSRAGHAPAEAGGHVPASPEPMA